MRCYTTQPHTWLGESLPCCRAKGRGGAAERVPWYPTGVLLFFSPLFFKRFTTCAHSVVVDGVAVDGGKWTHGMTHAEVEVDVEDEVEDGAEERVGVQVEVETV